MDEDKDAAIVFLDAMLLESHALAALREHRIALIDDLNRLSGPPSPAMAVVQQEFLNDRMDPAETLAFATVCYGLLAEAVAHCSLHQAGQHAAPDHRDDSNVFLLAVRDTSLGSMLSRHKQVLFSDSTESGSGEAKSTDSRQDLVDRYNDAVGPPGPQVAVLQQQFLRGTLEPSVVAHYIQQCEDMITARHSLRQKQRA